MLHLYYKEGKLTKWRKVPIDFRNYDEAKNYYEKNLKGPMTKFKILFEEEEKEIAAKKEKRKKTIVKAGKTIKKGVVATHKRLQKASARDMERIKKETPEFKAVPTYKTAYHRRLRELEMERRTKEREVTAEQLERLAEKRVEEKYRKKVKQAQKTTKKVEKRWEPKNPFGEMHFNPQGATVFGETERKGEKLNFGNPFGELKLNVDINNNPFGYRNETSKKRNKK